MELYFLKKNNFFLHGENFAKENLTFSPEDFVTSISLNSIVIVQVFYLSVVYLELKNSFTKAITWLSVMLSAFSTPLIFLATSGYSS